MSKPHIISLEGSRRSGKSFAAGYLKTNLEKECVFLPTEERTQWLWDNTPAFPTDYNSARFTGKWFFDQTQQKYDQISDEDRIFIFQRDYLSPLSFSYAFTNHFRINVFDDLLSDCKRKLESGEFKSPDLRLIFDNDFKLFLERAKRTSEKTIEDIWYNEDFSNYYFEFYRIFAKQYEPSNSILLESFVKMEQVKEIIELYVGKS